MKTVTWPKLLTTTQTKQLTNKLHLHYNTADSVQDDFTTCVHVSHWWPRQTTALFQVQLNVTVIYESSWYLKRILNSQQ